MRPKPAEKLANRQASNSLNSLNRSGGLEAEARAATRKSAGGDDEEEIDDKLAGVNGKTHRRNAEDAEKMNSSPRPLRLCGELFPF